MTALSLLGLVCLHLALVLTFLAAGSLTAAALGARHLLVLVLAGVTGFGVLAALTFWCYLAAAGLGHGFAIGATLASALVCMLAGRRLVRAGALVVLGPLLAPVSFFAAITLLMTALGYLRGGTGSADLAGRSRYLPQLPTDSQLPMTLARQLQNPARPLPHFLAAPWQASDRPPLQTGAYLLQQGVLGDGRFLDYQLTSMIAQSFWVFGVWAFMRAARLGNRAVAVTLAAVGFSGFTIVNTFFVWPKLFPAGYLMLAAAAVLGGSFETFRRSLGAALLLGLAVGCAMLGHPGSLFAAAALAVTALVVGRRPSWRLTVAAGAGLTVLYLPWLLFGKFYAPPGNFLTKWQLAGVYNYKDQRSVGQAVSQAYRAAGLSGTLRNKWLNLTAPFHDSLQVWINGLRVLGQHPLTATGTGSWNDYQVELSIFTFYVPALGVLAWGMLALAVRLLARAGRTAGSGRQLPALRLGGLGLICLLVNWLVWALVLFGPGKTTNQQSSYFLQLLGCCLGVIGWWLVSPRLATALVAGQGALSLWLYGYRPPLASLGPPVIGQHLQSPMACLAVAALGLCALSLYCVAAPDPESILTAGYAGNSMRKAVSDGSSQEHAVLAGGPAVARRGSTGPGDGRPIATHRRLDGAHRDR